MATEVRRVSSNSGASAGGHRKRDRYGEARTYLRNSDPVLAKLIDEHPQFDPRSWMEQLPKMDAFGTLLFQIVGQQLSVSATRAILARMEALFDGRLPEPQDVVDADPDQLHGVGLSRRKVETIRTLAQWFAADAHRGESLVDSSDEEIEAALTTIPGIGPWAVSGFLMIALDRPDVFPSGDLALRRAVQGLYGLDHMPSTKEILEIADRWRPYRTLAASYLFASEYES
jgi:DNA-3-methyladenine glycosylase II